MTSAEIRAFILVCQEMSISKAAERLYISQSSLSTKIKTLEKELGYQLVERGRGQRTLNLTNEGKEFYELALKYNDLVESMMSIGRKEDFSSFTVSTVNSMGNFLFTSIYDMFMERHPGVSLQIQDQDTNVAYENLIKGNTDLAFTISRREYPGISSYPVFGEPMVFVCCKDSEFPEEVHFKNLDIRHEVYVPWTDTFVDWHNVTLGSSDNTQIKIEIMSQLYYFLTKEKSWAIVPSSVANYLKNDNRIEERKMAFDVPMRIGICAFANDKSKMKLINSFLECLRDVLVERKESDIIVFKP